MAVNNMKKAALFFAVITLISFTIYSFFTILGYKWFTSCEVFRLSYYSFAFTTGAAITTYILQKEVD